MKKLALIAVLLGGCGSPAKPAEQPSTDPAARVRAFEETEDEVLRQLATIDRRIAQRARITPREEDLHKTALGALIAEDPSVAVVEGAIDPFSFEARARGLASIKEKIAKVPSDLPANASGMTPAPKLERDLLARLVDEEVLRLEEERALPRSASSLVRALVDTWPAVSDVKQIPERDRWVSRRLVELRESLTKATLDPVSARELDDALDSLEHLVDAPGFQKSNAELVRVRDALEAQGTRPRQPAHSDWADVERRLRAHVGLTATPEVLEKELEAAQKTLDKLAAEALRAAKIKADTLPSKLSAVLFVQSDCLDAVPGSRVRSMAAPPERGPACHLRHLVASAGDDTSRFVALTALREHVVVARWALDVARGRSTLSEATSRHFLSFMPDPDVMARLERIAQVRPVMAIAAGELARTLAASEDPVKRAREWNELGDVPFDVAER